MKLISTLSLMTSQKRVFNQPLLYSPADGNVSNFEITSKEVVESSVGNDE